jgi:signal transduction histidine kinase/CheY-like chemotaxis protein/HAMP domain-containing protein
MLNLGNISIRRKQTLIIMLTSSIVLLLACAAFIAFDTVIFRRELSERITVLADAIGNNCAAAIDFNDLKAAEESLAALRADNNIVSACVFSRDGQVFAVYQRDGASPFVPPIRRDAGQKFTSAQLQVFRPIEQQGVTTGTIFVASDLKDLSARLLRYIGIVGLVFLASSLLAFMLSSQLQRLVSDPILQLAQAVQTVTLEKNYSVRATKQSNDELGQLVDGFNEMLAQIQARDTAVQLARDSLELRVQERTAELAKSNVALNESQALYQSLVEHMPAGVFRKDREGRYVFVNSWFCRLKDMKADEILGKTPRELAAYDESAAEAGTPSEMLNSQRGLAIQGTDNHETIMRPGQPIKVEEVYPQPDGTVQHLQAVKSPVFAADGTIIGTQGIIFDVTDRKRLETQLLQSQKMETVGKLAGGIAHEFNSILTAIIGQSELLLGDLPAGSPLAKSATEISKAAGRAATLTRQLLAYGRKQILQPETLDLNRVIASMEGMFHHLMGGDVDTQIIPAPGLQAVLADAGQIEQVIINMVINARDAMPNGGKLTLETANVSFDQESVGRYPELKAGDYVMLAITDTGMGMSEEVKARLFEPFFSTKGVGQGTGLGLSTCYGIIKQSGGHISVYSELARGATFKIYLPQVEQQTKIPLPRVDSLDLPRGTETILLVEDDPALREMAATLLRRLGYTVLAAANGIEALSLTHERSTGHIDLLFTDVVMPHMSGKELSERVRMLFPQTKILFTSAYTENAIVLQGVLNQGVAFLQKPFTPSALAHKVREILDIGKA